MRIRRGADRFTRGTTGKWLFDGERQAGLK